MTTRVQLAFRTVIISDTHLGTYGCRAEELAHFLKHVRCDRLVLNGDIIDVWQLMQDGSYWTAAHTRIVRRLLKMMEKRRTEIVYLRGNHDDMLSKVLPLRFDRLTMREDYRLETERGTFLVLHGDVLDLVTLKCRWLARIGGYSYDLLIWLNHLLNRARRRLGRPPSSLSRTVKSRVKKAMQYISEFELNAARLAKERQCDGIIVGHIHAPADRELEGVRYLNSGDWVEGPAAVVEHADGRLELLEYAEFLRRLEAERIRAALSRTESTSQRPVRPPAMRAPGASDVVFEPVAG